MGLLDSNIVRRSASVKTFNISSSTKTFDVAGYRSVALSIKVPAAVSGTATISFTNEKGLSLSAMKADGTIEMGTIPIVGYGTLRFIDFVINVTNTKSLNITMSSALSGGDVEVTAYCLYDEMNVEKLFNDNVFYYSKPFSISPKTFYILRLRIDADTYDNVARVVRFSSSSDGNTFSNKNCFISGQSGFTPVTYVTLNNLNEAEIWFYNDSDKFFKATPDYVASPLGIRYEYMAASNIERRFKMPHNSYSGITDVGPFKYVKVILDGLTSTGKATYISISNARDSANNRLAPSFYLANGEKPMLNNSNGALNFTSYGGSTPGFYFKSLGENTDGRFVLKYEKEIVSFTITNDYAGNELFGPTTSNFPQVVIFSNEPIENEEKHISSKVAVREKYDVETFDIDGDVIDAYGEDILVRTSDTTWDYYQFGFNGIKTGLVFDATHCPSMIEGETVKFARLIPMVGGSPVGRCSNRVVLFTNKNRILYNRARNEYGCELSYFREAELINTKKRWYPVDSKSDVSSVAKYLPIFPEYDYNQFDGRIGDGTETDAFGLKKPTRGDSVGTLLEDFHKENIIGKLAYSSFVVSEVYGTVWGNYNLTNGDPWLAITPDGSKWYIVQSFGSVADYADITNLKVNLSPILTNAGGYTSGDLKITWRKYNVPDSMNKEPSTPFIIGDSCVVDTITADSTGTIVTFVDDSAFYSDQYTRYKFTNYRQVVFFENLSNNSEYDYICNSVNADGSDNTGVFFRLVRIDGTHQYRLYGDVGNPYEGENVCRHIHSVSETASGFLIATGENYNKLNDTVPIFEGGFLFYLPANNRNAELGLSNPQNSLGDLFRICSTMEGVNRACGAYLKSNEDNTLIYVSDDINGDLDKNPISITGRTETLKRRPFGVISGNLEDVDEQSKFGCIAELKNAAIGLVYHKERLAVCLFGGDAVFSTDFGKTWHQETLEKVRKGVVVYYTDVTGISSDGGFFYGNNKIIFK